MKRNRFVDVCIGLDHSYRPENFFIYHLHSVLHIFQQCGGVEVVFLTLDLSSHEDLSS